MLSSSFIDIAIGIIFVFLLLSLIASTVNEIVLSFMAMRGKYLLRGLKTLLNDTTGTGLVSAIYNHGQVYGLFEGKYDEKKPRNLPSYIPTNNFVMAFIGSIPEAPLAIARGLENKAKNAADEAEKRATKTRAPDDNVTAQTLRAKATKATEARAAAETRKAELTAALDSVKSAAKSGIGLPAAAAKADAAAKAAEQAKKAAEANPNDADAAAKATQSAKDAEAAKQERDAAQKALGDLDLHMAAVFASLKAVASDLANTPGSEKVGKPLLEMLNQAGNNLDILKASLASWYDSAMDRVSGWYKYDTQKWLIGIGLVLAVALNADTVRIVTQLSKDSTLRQSIVAAAQQSVPAPKTGATQAAAGTETSSAKPAVGDPEFQKMLKNVEHEIEDLQHLGIPLGWADDTDRGFFGWLAKVFGLLITAVAISMGAPFWFDLLNKFMVVRSTVKPREKSKEEGSKDKATAASPAA